MDNSNWKRILLHWANNSGLYERSYQNLEQIDIEEFFIKFNEHLTNRLDEIDGQLEIAAFLKEQYPEFEFHLDDNNHLSTSDYMYIYSILLHYCCVKCPERYFHTICENLHEQFQLAIASFFKALLNKELTKSNIRNAISEAVPKNVLISINNNNNNNNNSDSPTKTPRSLKDDLSPPTPKTNLLEERKKELNLLRAMLETEKYERGFLEVQLEKYEDKIKTLSQERKKLTTKIQELQNDLLTISTENSFSKENMEEEQIKKRLRKEISDKEELIISLKLNIESLEEEKNLISEKLSYAQQQVKTCLEKIKDMDNAINDLKTENERKDEAIENLLEKNNELVQFINETRNNGGSNRTMNDLNISAEYLDVSFTRNNTSTSGDSFSSPENLGRTVVDVQLREKETENRLLREQIDKMNLDNSKLVQHINELMIKYSNVFEICNENLLTNEKGDNTTETFIVFESYVEKLTENYLNSCNIVQSLKEEVNQLNSQNNTINEKIKNLEESIRDYEKRIDDNLKEKNTLTKELDNLKSVYDECMHKLNDEIQEKNTIIESMENLKKTFDDLKCEKENQKMIFLKEIEEKEKLVDERKTYIESLDSQINEYSKKLALIEIQKENLLKEKTKLSDDIRCLTKELENSNDVVMELSKANEEMQNRFQEVEIASEDMAKEIEKLVADNEMKENTIKLLASELNIYDEQIITLNSKLEHLSTVEEDLIQELNKTNMEMEAIKKTIELSNTEKDKINTEFEKYRLEKDEIIMKLENEIKNYKNEMKKNQEMYDEVKKNIQVATERIQSLEIDTDKTRQENEKLIKKIAENDTEYENLRSLTEILKDEKNMLQEEMQREKQTLIQKIELLEENNRKFDHEIRLIVMKIEENEEIKLNTETLSNITLKKLKDNLNHLLNENTTLKKEINNLRDVISELERKINELKYIETEVIEKNQKLCEMDTQLKSEKKSYEKEKVVLDEKINKLMDDIKYLENINSNLKEINSKLENNSIDLNNELKQKQEKNVELSKTVESLQFEIGQLNFELKESRQEIEIAEEKARDAGWEKNQIALELQLKMDQHQTFEKETVKNLKNKSDFIKHLEDEQKKLNDDIISKEKQISELLKVENSLKDENNELIELYNESKNNINDILLNYNKKIKGLLKDVDNLKKEKEKLQEDCKNTKVSYEQKIEMMEKQHLDEINLHKQKIDENEEKFKIEKSEIEKELSNCRDKINSFDNKCTKFISEIGVMKLEQSEIIEKNNLLKDELTTLQNKYKMNELNLICYKESINILKHKVTDLEGIINIAEKDVIDQKTRNEELQAQIDLLNKENADQKSKSDEICANLNKRIERISYQLGESQAKIKQLEKDKDDLRRTCDSNQLIFENLKSQNEKIILELEQYVNKYSEMLKINDVLKIKNQNLKIDNEIMKDQFDKYEIKNSEILENIKFLENENQKLENRIKSLTENCSKISDNLEDIKKENEILHNTNELLVSDIIEFSEIFQLNKDDLINECRNKLQNFNEIQNENNDLKNDIENLQIKLKNAEENNHKLIDDIKELSSRLDVMQNNNEMLKTEINQLKMNVNDLELEKQKIENENINSFANLKELQLKEIEIIDERINLEKYYKDQILDLEKILNEKNTKIDELEKMLNNNIELDEYNKEIDKKNLKINELEMKMNEFEKNYEKEKDFNENLQKDIDILRAKLVVNRKLLEVKENEWNIEKKKLIEISETAENRIKENRLELEGKLEKMKNKMKTLYNDEITKIKSKHERDIEVLKIQNKKYESHTQTLSKQIYELNEDNLELKKQNKFMETRLKNSESVAVTSSSSNLRRHNHYTSTPAGLNPNLQMEDEEGEVFDNMYLTELKNGRRSPTNINRESITVDELKYRNSLAPPHLKSTYLAQYVDHNLPEEDIKDGFPATYFDDSLSSLLHTGQRKKLTGTTLYKKPGPPTPSKNAGRLSIGGASTGSNNDYSNHPREILKEVHDSRKATPNKFHKFLSSNKSKDESLSEPFQIIRERKRSLTTIPNGAFTSTPRKSKAHYDQRRQLDLYLNTSSSAYSTNNDSNGGDIRIMQLVNQDINQNHLIDANNKIFDIKTPNNLKQNSEAFIKWRQPNSQSPLTTPTTETSESNSPHINAENDNSIKSNDNSMTKINRVRRRISIYYRGNIISNSKLPSNVIRNQMRNRAKQQRCVTFNKYRKSLNEITLRKSLLTGNYRKQEESEKQQQQQQQKDNNFNDDDDNNDDNNNNEMISIQTVDSVDGVFTSNDVRNYRFEQLLKNKESRSPFENNNKNMNEINLITTTTTTDDIMMMDNDTAADVVDSGRGDDNHIGSGIGGISSNMTTISHCTGTTNLTAASSSKTTIYTNSIIINRKIPHIDKTIARKMSLFLGSANGRGVILLAGQTISIMDLLILWNRLTLLTKFIFILFFFTFILHIYFAMKN